MAAPVTGRKPYVRPMAGWWKRDPFFVAYMIRETTALGAAYLAGLSAGVYPEPSKFADNWRLEHRFKPAMSAATRERKLAGWARAVKGLLASDEGEG